ncbi:aspartyl-phosphate phosphatase Spo0E family protein [Paraliobacillus sp. PM-2]|uniref:aspartyl-phosphate phosphatase Spo0E family protein n=1 Tax=Paraliobacillus sp. PM-2 TaxID=1462524 RepID=UPI000B85DE2E|nr:aspartyl-phosphate phosphatase Spo0E family protein [Paraliobacillus sp. PM-2]
MSIILALQDQNLSLDKTDKEKLEEIEKLRHQMYQYYKCTKNKQDVITVSQELDKLIYDYIASTNKKN